MSYYQRTVLLSVGNEASTQIAERTLDVLGSPPLFQHIRDVELTNRDEWQDRLTQALKDISDAQIHTQLIRQGFNVRHEEISLWLFLGVGAPWEVDIHDIIDTFIDVAWRELRSVVQIEVLLWSHPQWIAETQSALASITSLSQPVQHIFLVSSVTESGLVLNEDAVAPDIAMAVGHMMTTSLTYFLQPNMAVATQPRPWSTQTSDNDEQALLEPSAGSPESPPLFALGVNSYANPMPDIISKLVQDWIQNVSGFLAAQFEKSESNTAIQNVPEALLPWQPKHLWQLLVTRLQKVSETKNADVIDFPGLFRLARLTQERQLDFENRRQALIGMAETSITNMIAPKLAKWRQYLTKEEAAALDLVGGQLQINSYRQALRAYHQQWVEWAASYQHQAETVRAQQSPIEDQMANVWKSIEKATTMLAIHSIRDILQMMRPLHLLALIQSYLKLPSQLSEYEQSAQRWLELEVERKASEMMRQYCLAAAEDVVSASQHLAKLSDRVAMIAKATHQSGDKPIEAMSASELDRLRKVCFFDDELPLTRCLEKTPLRIWRNLDIENLRSQLQGFAEEWLSPLHTWSAADILAFTMHDDEQIIQSWLHHFLDRTEALWPHQQPQLTGESRLAILLPSEKFALLHRIATNSDLIQHIVDGAHFDPLLVIRFQPLNSID